MSNAEQPCPIKKLIEYADRGRAMFPAWKWATGSVYRYNDDNSRCEACMIGFAAIGVGLSLPELKEAVDASIGTSVCQDKVAAALRKDCPDGDAIVADMFAAAVVEVNDTSNAFEEVYEKLPIALKRAKIRAERRRGEAA